MLPGLRPNVMLKEVLKEASLQVKYCIHTLSRDSQEVKFESMVFGLALPDVANAIDWTPIPHWGQLNSNTSTLPTPYVVLSLKTKWICAKLAACSMRSWLAHMLPSTESEELFPSNRTLEVQLLLSGIVDDPLICRAALSV